MYESLKPWGSSENIFDWYYNDCRQVITSPITKTFALDIMGALYCIKEAVLDNTKGDPIEYINTLAEVIASPTAEDTEKLLEELVVQLSMHKFDSTLNDLLDE